MQVSGGLAHWLGACTESHARSPQDRGQKWEEIGREGTTSVDVCPFLRLRQFGGLRGSILPAEPTPGPSFCMTLKLWYKLRVGDPYFSLSTEPENMS